jgi:hypothetical protein
MLKNGTDKLSWGKGGGEGVGAEREATFESFARGRIKQYKSQPE